MIYVTVGFGGQVHYGYEEMGRLKAVCGAGDPDKAPHRAPSPISLWTKNNTVTCKRCLAKNS